MKSSVEPYIGMLHRERFIYVRTDLRYEVWRCSDRSNEGARVLDAQGALGAGYFALFPWNAPSGLFESDSQGLKSTLRAVVVIETAKAVNVNGDAGGLSKRVHAVRYHLTAQVADLFALEAQVNDAEGPVGQVHDRTAQSLIKRHMGGPKAGKASGGAQSLRKSISQREATVLGRVVIVNCSPRRIAVSK